MGRSRSIAIPARANRPTEAPTISQVAICACSERSDVWVVFIAFGRRSRTIKTNRKGVWFALRLWFGRAGGEEKADAHHIGCTSALLRLLRN